MPVEVAYEADGTAWGGRRGRVTSSDGRIDLQLSMPRELGGDGGEGTNPEQLLAAGYAACFHSALKAIARGEKVDANDSAVTVTIGLGQNDQGNSELAAKISAELPGVDRTLAMSIMERAHTLCPYSNATRGNIDVTLDLAES